MAEVGGSDAVRDELESERVRLRKHIEELASDADGAPAHDENFADSAQVAAEMGEARALAGSLREQLDDVEEALKALDEGRYGLCEVCSQPIAEARLEAMPTTRRCIDHA
ncbi:TraR/DksA family transcriptional regulator [Actinomarinicola tropica]|uniref:TraR/DksA family transcriptional regulator n=1 Tax=Actinomarinicola tropica TaxID=2789776 RepID=A0A5Q2RMW2_9ACTN|nr:TraR/DksA C4-type zinc finger protein [Actinomarinicola tropica]QGG95230.1 TraR/DksA family transcriptional regulator [Actinomarinicola tropica]